MTSVRAQQADDTPTPASVEIVGRRAGGDYLVQEASGAKTDLPLRELPQAVRIMSRQALDDLGAVRVDDALDYVGGVSRQNNFGGMWDNIAIRGLAGDANTGMAMLQNGFAANRGFRAPRDTANLERIEFLKGTAAALYGASEPGGTVNFVTKSPQWRSARAAELYAGSYDSYRAAVDATGPLGDRLAYRLNLAHEDRGSFREHVGSRRTLVAPALTWRLARGNRFDYRGEFLRHEGTFDRGIPFVGGAIDAVPRERFLGEPGDGKVRVQNHTHQLVLEHLLESGWRLRAGFGFLGGDMRGYSTEAQPTLEADERTMRRQRRYRDYRSRDTSAHAELGGSVDTGAISHQLLVGAEASRLDAGQRQLRASPSAARPYAIDVFAPVYGQPRPEPGPNTDTEDKQEARAFYLQDTVRLGERWRLVAALRADRLEQELRNLRSGRNIRQTPQAHSPRAGLSFLASDTWTLFANGGRSFRPKTGADASGQAFSPEEGRAFEIGAKWQNSGQNSGQNSAGALGATVALFDIRKRNVLTADPRNPDFSIAAGEVRSRGLDADLSGQLTRAWRINASLSWIDAEVIADNTLQAGSRLLNVPRLNGSLMLLHETVLANGARIGVGGALTHSAERLAETRTAAQAQAGAPDFTLPAYSLARLVAWWQLSPSLRLSLDIDNLFDRSYYTSSVQRTWVTPGPSRSATLGLQARF
jgi:iron complex outermembrane receptor protein